MYFHDILVFILTFIFISSLWLTQKRFSHKGVTNTLLRNSLGECLWTVYPAAILFQIGLPSLTLLYIIDETVTLSQVSLKAIGHQWYWSYEYTDSWSKIPKLRYDAYMLSEKSGTPELPRLLDVDNRRPLPYGLITRVMVSSADVLHAWAVPSLGVKVDACPGRLNQQSLMSYRPGIRYGQCSEICGANHRFIPITLETISPKDFFWWNQY